MRLSVQGQHGNATVDIDVERGGRIAQVEVDGIGLLIPPPPPGDRDRASVKWGAYPMAPWAGRVRDGRFTYLGVEHELFLNQDDSGVGTAGRQHAMHGTVLSAAWQVDEQTLNTLALSCALEQPGSGWTLGGVAHQRFELLDGQLRCDMAVAIHPDPDPHAHPPDPFPAEIGWHPWWVKPDSLSFHPDAMYERDTVGLPTGRLVRPSAGPWDDCFVNTAPVTLHYDRPDVAQITLSSDCDHWVVYDMPDHATCVEPQSGPPNAFNLRPQITSSTHQLRRTMTVSW